MGFPLKLQKTGAPSKTNIHQKRMSRSVSGLDHECQADTNGDGMIEYDEFLEYFNNHEPDLEQVGAERCSEHLKKSHGSCGVSDVFEARYQGNQKGIQKGIQKGKPPKRGGGAGSLRSKVIWGAAPCFPFLPVGHMPLSPHFAPVQWGRCSPCGAVTLPALKAPCCKNGRGGGQNVDPG